MEERAGGPIRPVDLPFPGAHSLSDIVVKFVLPILTCFCGYAYLNPGNRDLITFS